MKKKSEYFRKQHEHNQVYFNSMKWPGLTLLNGQLVCGSDWKKKTKHNVATPSLRRILIGYKSVLTVVLATKNA